MLGRLSNMSAVALSLLAAGASALNPVPHIERITRPRVQPEAFGLGNRASRRNHRSRIAGPRRPAGSKLLRMASEGRIGLRH